MLLRCCLYASSCVFVLCKVSFYALDDQRFLDGWLGAQRGDAGKFDTIVFNYAVSFTGYHRGLRSIIFMRKCAIYSCTTSYMDRHCISLFIDFVHLLLTISSSSRSTQAKPLTMPRLSCAAEGDYSLL